MADGGISYGIASLISALGSAAGTGVAISSALDQQASADKARKQQGKERAALAEQQQVEQQKAMRRAASQGNTPSTLFGNMVGVGQTTTKLGGGG